MDRLYKKKHYQYYKWSVFAIILIIAFLFAQSVKSYERVMIRPSKVELECGKNQQFTVVNESDQQNLTGVNSKVKWSVNGIPGGSHELGTIDNNGLYSAPNKVPTPAEIQICAERVGG